jgi:hypothetical protein
MGAALVALGSPALAAQWVIEDGLAPDQVSEVTEIFIDGTSVGRFDLTLASPTGRIVVELPDVPATGWVGYVLCGRTTVRLADGSLAGHVVDDSGAIENPDGRRFFAYTDHYAAFFLLEEAAEGRVPARVRTHLGARCPAPVS